MVASAYIASILNLLLDDDEYKLAGTQLPYLNDFQHEYTGTGLCVRFSFSGDYDKHRLPWNQLILEGVKVYTPDMPQGAYVTLYIIDGLINCMQIGAIGGNYPNTEPVEYTIVQEWDGSEGKSVTFP